MKEKVLIGNGGFAREIIADYGKKLKCFVSKKYWNDDCELLEDFDPDKHLALIAVGDPKSKLMLQKQLPAETIYWTHISKRAHVLDIATIEIGDGCAIMAGCVLTTNIKIGNHVHLNLNTTVGHDSEIMDYSTTAPAVNVSGNVTIHDFVYLGTGAIVREKLQICKNCTIGMNAGVVKSITKTGTYIGTPAKLI